MILIASREEGELLKRLRKLGAGDESVEGLSAQVVTLKKQIATLEIEKSQKQEEHDRQDRELRHMIGLERKRQEVELQQAKKGNNLLDACPPLRQDPPASAGVCPAGRLWSLWDIMEKVRGSGLAVSVQELSDYMCMCERDKAAGHTTSSALATFELAALRTVESLCKDNPAFKSTLTKVRLIQIHLKHKEQPDISTIAADLRNVRDMLMNDMWNVAFLQVESKYRQSLDSEMFLGEPVAKSFKKAHQDIKDAANALAVGFPNAAVFHLMRVTEWGIRALAVHLGFRRLKSKRKKSGEVYYTPMEYAEWEKILNQIQERVDKRVEKIKRGQTKQREQEFYYPILQDIRGLRDAWRNHVMHTRSVYTQEDAEAVLSHVKRLMGTMATRISEV